MSIKDKILNIQDFITSNIGYETDITTGVKELASKGGGTLRNNFPSLDDYITFEHRGIVTSDTSHYYENTLEMFELAYERGCGGIEFDVWFSTDDVPYVSHTSSFRKTDYNYCSIIENPSTVIDADRTLGMSTYKVPKLEEVLDFCKKHKMVALIEMKDFVVNDEHVTALLDLIEQYEMTDHVIIDAFTYDWLVAIKNANDSIRVAYAIDGVFDYTYLSNLLALKTTNNVVYADMSESYATKSDIDTLIENDIVPSIWTIKNLGKLLKFIDYGVKHFTCEMLIAEFVVNAMHTFTSDDFVQGKLGTGSDSLIVSATNRIATSYKHTDMIPMFVRSSWVGMYYDAPQEMQGYIRCLNAYSRYLFDNSLGRNIGNGDFSDSQWINQEDYQYNATASGINGTVDGEQLFFGMRRKNDSTTVPSDINKVVFGIFCDMDSKDYIYYRDYMLNKLSS